MTILGWHLLLYEKESVEDGPRDVDGFLEIDSEEVPDRIIRLLDVGQGELGEDERRDAERMARMAWVAIDKICPGKYKRSRLVWIQCMDQEDYIPTKEAGILGHEEIKAEADKMPVAKENEGDLPF